MAETARRQLPAVSKPVFVAAVVTAATLALAVRDPHVPGSWGFCPGLFLTGIACPFCGGLSATHDLATGQIGQALRDNLYTVTWFLPLMGWLWGRWFLRSINRPAKPIPQPVARLLLWSTIGLAVLFTVLRNLPFGAGLNPYYGATPLTFW